MKWSISRYFYLTNKAALYPLWCVAANLREQECGALGSCSAGNHAAPQPYRSVVVEEEEETRERYIDDLKDIPGEEEGRGMYR